jgi:hypothetical protein
MGRRTELLEAAPRRGRLLMLVMGTPGRPAGASRSRPAGLPGHGSDVVHAPRRIRHHEWRCVRRPTLDAGVGRGDATSESLWATQESLPRGDHRRWRHLPCPTVPSVGFPRRRRRPLGSPYRHWGRSPRRPPATVLWHRLAGAPLGGGDADAVRTGSGRRQLGEQVSDLTLPQSLVLLQAHPTGLHDRRHLIEQAGCPGGVGRHVTHPLPRMLRPWPSD